MADKNSEITPPNPFHVPTSSTPGSLFSVAQSSEASQEEEGATATPAPPSTSLSGTTSATSIFPSVFTSQGQLRSFPTSFGGSPQKMSSSSTEKVSEEVTVSLKSTAPAKDTPTSIFGNPQTCASSTAPPSTLFGGANGSSSKMIGSGNDAQSDSDATPSTTVASVFGGAGAGCGLVSSGEVCTSVFGGGGVSSSHSPFGQFTVSAVSKAKLSSGLAAATETSGSVHPPVGAASKVFGLATPTDQTPSESPESETKSSRKTSKSPSSSSKSKSSKPKSPEARAGHQYFSSSPEFDKKDVTKIIVAQIPDSCMSKDTLKAHFSKFGEIKRLVLNPRVGQATVLYDTHHAASRAKRKGRKINPEEPEVRIFYGAPARRKSEEVSSDATLSKKKAIKTLQPSTDLDLDLDPYTPLERPGTQPSTTLPRKLNRPKVTRLTPEASPTPVTPRLKVPKKKARKKSPAREAKEATVSLNDCNLPGVLECQARSNSDKYIILKARDKLLRKERCRPSDLKKASYLAATCPDMCPELERYMRDVQSDLSTSFEMTDGVLDHRLVIKKFSRSSADKDLPLPHELRPGPVLLRTMDFLVCNIISRGDEEGMEADVWYNYLWNRTRAVRNDLMQQQLTDATAVAIMERCTRFHIYAATRLCEEPLDLYDAKLNTEHLTKSLQTLKELYHDLGEKGEYFSTEGEFRAYEMLLNLNEGETIVNQYAQFREDVQKSTHVQFALKVVLAVMFNNYVKFFKLIRGAATYLQGCLLHRYFRQIRSRAIETMIKSYMPPKGPQSIPLNTVISVLGFEDENEAVGFLKCHGISVVDSSVSLDKHSFNLTPEEMPPLVKPHKLVEVNRRASVGEVIQGGPIPDNPLHTHIPHDSFDSQGYLRPEAKDASDQFGVVIERPLEIRLSPVIHQPEAQQNYELVSHMKDVYSMVESSVLQELATQISGEAMEVVRCEEQKEVATQSVAWELLEESMEQEVEELSHEGYREVEQEEREKQRKQREEKERRRKALEKLRNTVACMLHDEYCGQFVGSCIRQVCEEAVQEVVMEVALEELMGELPQEFCMEVVLEEVLAVSKEAIEEMTIKQEEKIQAFKWKIDLRKTAEHFQVWRWQTQRARHRKQSQVSFPATCSSLTPTQQSKALGWGYTRHLGHNISALQLAQLEGEIKDILKKLTIKNQLVKECAWHPLPLQHYLAQVVEQSLPAEHNLVTQYFKVVVCRGEEVRPEIMLWLRSKLGGQGSQDILQPLKSSFNFVSQKSGLEYAWVMREVCAETVSVEDIQGTSLLLYVSSGQNSRDIYHNKVRELLSGMPRVSFFEISFDCYQELLDGWSLVEEDLVKPETSDKLQSLLLEFWKHQSEQIFVASSCLNDFVYSFVVKKFLEPASLSYNQRKMDGKSPLPPYALIDLYNSVLDSLLEAVADEDLASLSWPPPELTHLTQIPPSTWNKEDMNCMAILMGQMKLPPLKVEGAITWATITETLYSYASTVSGSRGEVPVLASHLDAILSDARKCLDPLYLEGEGEEAFSTQEIHPLLVPWLQIIYACASYKLSGLPSTKVYYQPKRLQTFPCPQSWQAACRTSDPGWVEVWEVCNTEGSRKRKAEREEEPKVAKVKMVQSKLLEDIVIEKQKCTEFERNLENMLDIEEELKLLSDC